MNYEVKNLTPKDIIRQIRYIHKWHRGAKLIRPTQNDISGALDGVVRYIRYNERSKDNTPLTEEILRGNGFRCITDSICLNDSYTQYKSPDGMIIVSTNLSHTPGRPYYVSVDDADMNSVGGLDCGTLHHVNSLLDLCDYTGPRLKPISQ